MYHDEEFRRTDPDRSLFNQIKQEAESRDNKGMVGLEWIGADGLRYRVSDHEKLTRIRQGDKKKLPKKSLSPRIYRHPVKGLQIVRKTVDDPVEEKVDYRTVDVINKDGDIVDVKTFTGYRRVWKADDTLAAYVRERSTGVPQGEYDIIDNFEDYFMVGAHINQAAPGSKFKKPREILGFRWAGKEKEPATASRGIVAGPEIEDWNPRARLKPEGPEEMKPKTPEDKTQDLFEKLAEQQADLGLHDWSGLTWSTPFPLVDKKTRHWQRENAAQMQIIRDFIIIRNADSPAISYPERVFEVRTTLDGKTTNRHIYTLAELMLQFSRREAHDRKVRKRRGEDDYPQPGSTAPTDEEQQLALNALYEELGHSPDLDLRWETPPRRNEPKVESRGPKQRITEKEIERLHKMHDQDLKRLGVKLPDGEESLGWFKDYLETTEGEDPAEFMGGREGHAKRSDALDGMLGTRFSEFAVIKQQIESKDKNGDEDSEKEFVKIMNPLVTVRLQKLLFKKKILGGLGMKETRGKVEFDPDAKELTVAELGSLIRLSYGEVYTDAD